MLERFAADPQTATGQALTASVGDGVSYEMCTGIVEALEPEWISQEAPLHGVEDGTPLCDEHPDRRGAPQVLPSRDQKRSRETTGRTVRRPMMRQKRAILRDRRPPTIGRRRELITRLLAAVCEICGQTEDITVHHIRKARRSRQGGHAATGVGAHHEAHLLGADQTSYPADCPGP